MSRGRSCSFGGWAVREPIGQSGANGDVYRATRGEVTGAIKVLKKRLWVGQRYDRFRREIHALELIETFQAYSRCWIGIAPTTLRYRTRHGL